MRIFGIECEISFHFLILFAAAIFIIPMRWLVAMITAAAVHEMGHLLMLRFSRIAVKKIAIELVGARIITAPLTLRQEFLCACAGPGAGMLLIGLGRVYPELAICAFTQSIYNLIPIMPFDGGRIFRCAMESILPQFLSEKVVRGTEMMIFCCVLFWGIRCLQYKPVMAACLAVAFVLATSKGKRTCNRVLSAVQ